MSKMLTKEELTEIRERRVIGYLDNGGLVQAVAHKNALGQHIDALTERLEGMADEWEKEANEIHVPVGPYGAGEAMAERDAINAKEEQLRALLKEVKG